MGQSFLTLTNPCSNMDIGLTMVLGGTCFICPSVTVHAPSMKVHRRYRPMSESRDSSGPNTFEAALTTDSGQACESSHGIPMLSLNGG